MEHPLGFLNPNYPTGGKTLTVLEQEKRELKYPGSQRRAFLHPDMYKHFAVANPDELAKYFNYQVGTHLFRASFNEYKLLGNLFEIEMLKRKP